MARIRTVKPEFWQHPKVTRVSRDARLLFLGLLNEADDTGRLRYQGKRLAGVLFPEDSDVDAGWIDARVDELELVELVRRYEVDGERLLVVVGFLDHQAINRPSPSRLPEPPGALTDSSVRPPAPVPDRSVGEGNREQGTGKGDPVVGSADRALVLVEPPVAGPDPVELVFAEWVLATGRARSVLVPKRRDLIARQLKHYPVEDLVAAVRGWRHSPHHCGANDRGETYNDLELLLRDAAHIERFRDLELSGGTAGRGRILPKGAGAIAAAVRAEAGR